MKNIYSFLFAAFTALLISSCGPSGAKLMLQEPIESAQTSSFRIADVLI